MILLCIRDFPGGEGESRFIGRATVKDIPTAEGRRMFGFEKFEEPLQDKLAAGVAKKCNDILFD